MKLSSIALILIILCIGCSGKNYRKNSKQSNKSSAAHEPDWDKDTASTQNTEESAPDRPFQKVRFEQDMTYGSTGEVLIGEMGSIAVDKQNRVFIEDEDQTTIQVFKPDGSYIKSLGRKGKGPGEFAILNAYTIPMVCSNKLYVPAISEFFTGKLQVFSLHNLSFSHVVKTLAENKNHYKLKKYFPKRVFPLKDGKFLVSYHQQPREYKEGVSYIRYFIQDQTGNIIAGPVLKQKDLTYLVYRYPNTHYDLILNFPFFGKSLLSVSGNDHLYAVKNTQEFKIDVYTQNGRQLRSFRYPFHNKPLSRGELLERYKDKDKLLKMIQHADRLPETWPALASMFIDDQNRIWVSTIIDNDKVYEWWVMKDTGEVITKFKWPRDKPVEQVRNNYMYTREMDAKNGIQEVVRYRIVQTKNE